MAKAATIDLWPDTWDLKTEYPPQAGQLVLAYADTVQFLATKQNYTDVHKNRTNHPI